jgi:hypothetical protein
VTVLSAPSTQPEGDGGDGGFAALDDVSVVVALPSPTGPPHAAKSSDPITTTTAAPAKRSLKRCSRCAGY